MNEDFLVYPNPAKGQLKVSWTTENQPTEVALVDMTGRVLLNKKIKENETTLVLDISKIIRGLYVLKIETKGRIKTAKILIENK